MIPCGGFNNLPSLEISDQGVSLNFSLALPNVSFGVFSLTNLSLVAGFCIPFYGGPLNISFGFCRRESPFLLTVSMFGGGGFFGMVLNADGLHMLEAAFEFGASLSVDFGVASGGVHVLAGIYYIQEEDHSATLTGYFRMGGKLNVLGLVSASIELYLGLSYEISSGKCVGRAQLTIEVSVLFFTGSVTITCERKFAGSNGDPSFAELMAPYQDPITRKLVDPWALYCGAFA